MTPVDYIHEDQYCAVCNGEPRLLRVTERVLMGPSCVARQAVRTCPQSAPTRSKLLVDTTRQVIVGVDLPVLLYTPPSQIQQKVSVPIYPTICSAGADPG